MNLNPINAYNATNAVETALKRGGGDVLVPPKPQAMGTLAADTVTISTEAQEVYRGGGDIINNPRPK